MNTTTYKGSSRGARRLIGGAGILAIGPIALLLFREPDADHAMLWMLAGWLIASVGILASGFGPAQAK